MSDRRLRFVLFVHSLFSDWNHGNAHFLRGITRELIAAGHKVRVLEPADGWSRTNLLAEPGGPAVLRELEAWFPELDSVVYPADGPDLDAALDGADVVLVHEWNPPELVAAIGRRRAGGGRFRLLFHDTHHRSVTRPAEMAQYNLSGFDGVLAFGAALRERYLAEGWTDRVWIWHEAADLRRFHPIPEIRRVQDLVWVGNWGDGERTQELRDYLLEPAAALGVSATVHGVRWPADGQAALAAAGIGYSGWLPNHRVPDAFAAARLTVHVPRRPYATALPGIPTIRVFEALACGIPLISAPWSDSEGLFGADDFLRVRSEIEMKKAMRELLGDPAAAATIAEAGRRTVLARHGCVHRVAELLDICRELGLPAGAGQREVVPWA